jgi:hypothetical protein
MVVKYSQLNSGDIPAEVLSNNHYYILSNTHYYILSNAHYSTTGKILAEGWGQTQHEILNNVAL